MSSLLADIALNFEALADDPIEMGIHYGKSVLRVLSARVAEPKRLLDEMVAKQKTFVATAKPTPTYRKPRFETPITTPRLSVERGFRRNFEQITTRAYTQRRDLVGSL